MSQRPHFTAVEVARLLTAADKYLTGRHVILIIGGSAASFAGADSTTTDVDTFESLTAELEQALETARSETGLDIPCGKSSVADVPYHAEDRVKRPLPDLQHLDVQVLERHDLALSKTLRYVEHDVVQLRAIHEVDPLDFEVLVVRFAKEMGHAVGDPRKHLDRFLSLIGELFGELKQIEAKRRLTRD